MWSEADGSQFLLVYGSWQALVQLICFDMYTRELKVSLKVEQSVIDVLKTYKRLGANLGVFAGLIAELLGDQLGFSFGICACVFVGNNAQNFTHTAALVTCVKNFPEKRGIVIGLLKGLIGLSGALITQLALAFYGDQSVRHILLLIAWFPAAIALASFTIRPMEFRRQPNELKVFFHIFYVSLSLAVFLMIVKLCERFFTFPRIGYVGSGIVILFLLALPLLIAIREERFILSLKQQPDNHPFAINTGRLQRGSSSTTGCRSIATGYLDAKNWTGKGCVVSLNLKHREQTTKRRGPHHLASHLQRRHVAHIHNISLTGFGSSTTAIGNLSEIAVSNDLQFNTMGNIKLLINIWNYFGRVYHAFPSENGIYMATVIIGFSYGAQMTLLCTITSEIFGLEYYATLLNCTQFATPPWPVPSR
ncbi:PREDICTED: NUCLEAR FUSION DEFECTIVE [Prunus dulcis]|uniref:PREDICTED: NUCLEAR FUSION DEFECTIVE n=1 Tax=Prunus dulcis TaxID=3755 RepID=A0A5E4G391_PRUDU|nr:PREDICTED: NUCLEAR FUSION DEFECTIVE [Prunus dulcis]